MERYLKNKSTISELDQEILQNSHVLVCGCGGLGGHIAHSLVRLGIGELTLIDSDVFEESNLNRQCFSNMNNLGYKKVDILKEELLKINPDCCIHTFTDVLDYRNLKLSLKNIHVIVDALDNFKLSLAFEKLNLTIPIVSGMISSWYGYVVVSTKDHPNISKLGEAFEEGSETELGNLVMVANTCAQLQATLVFKILTHRFKFLDGFYYLDLNEFELDYIKLN